jgi:hypothetical protein
MIAFTINCRDIVNNIYIPKYYDPELHSEITMLRDTHDLFVLGDLLDEGVISVQTGHEIGKMAYGTGSIPFVRTSDITNWEIKTIPKQGVSEEIYGQYADKEDVRDGDILLVRDGTYLIGANCLVTKLDLPMVFQSHILKFRIVDKDRIDPYLFFLVINCSLVQRQIRNIQFTADIIDTLGSRYRELILPFPKSKSTRSFLITKIKEAVETRVKYKAAIKQMPILIEQVLEHGDTHVFEKFFAHSIDELLKELVQDTTTLEFGGFSAFRISSHQIVSGIYLPKYYDPAISKSLEMLKDKCQLVTVNDLVAQGALELSTGDEIGKMAYGTGEIPFVRTSDFSNWEIKADTKQGVSDDIYEQYAEREDVQAGDILLVRDGTYLVGTSCIITECDAKILYCGGLYKIRTKDRATIDEYLLLGLLNSYIVKRQMRTKQFTRDVIDTLGKRIGEVVLPIPNDQGVRDEISKRVKAIVEYRIFAREIISELSEKVCNR